MWPFGTNSGNTPAPPITYIHTVSTKARRLTIKIDKSGQVVVVTPRFVPKIVIDQFVAQHQDWIVGKLATFTKSRKNSTLVSIYGKEYQKRIAYLPGQKLGIIIQGKAVVFNTPEAHRPQLTSSQMSNPHHAWGKQQDKALERFLKSSAHVYILKRTEQLAKKMGVAYGTITLREQSSRWGSCSSAGNLNFNWRLVHAEPAILDYVIVHELVHRVHMDHSRNFWNLVAQYDPDYQVHRGWLKRQGHALS
jgi:predicted metal-dependent hydrolase